MRTNNKSYQSCIFCLLSLYRKDDDIKRCIQKKIEGPEFKKIVEKAAVNNVAQIVYYNLSQLGLIQYINHEVKIFLERIYAGCITRNVSLKDELVHILKKLSENRIQVMLLKGALSFFEGYFSKVPIRYLQDIDIYIQPQNIEKALKCFYDMGYIDYVQEHEFHKTFYKSENINYYIELHYLPTAKSLMNYFESVSLWEKATVYESSGVSFCVPSPTHLFYYKLVHDTVQHKRLFRLDYHTLYDGAAIVNYYHKKILWDKFLFLIEKNGLDLNLQVYIQAIIFTGLFTVEIKRYVPINKKIQYHVGWIYRNAKEVRCICAKERFTIIHYKSHNYSNFVLKSFDILWNIYVKQENPDVLISLYPGLFKNKRSTIPFSIIKIFHFYRLLFLHGMVTMSFLAYIFSVFFYKLWPIFGGYFGKSVQKFSK